MNSRYITNIANKNITYNSMINTRTYSYRVISLQWQVHPRVSDVITMRGPI